MNQKNIWIALITLIVAIILFLQLCIMFAVMQLANQMDKRFAEGNQQIGNTNKRIDGLRAEMNQRLSDMATEIRDVRSEIRQLNQNYANHLAHHTGQGERK